MEKPLHVRVAEALESGVEIDMFDGPGPQNIASITEASAFPSIGATRVWWIRRPLPKDHYETECPYAYEGEPCECKPRVDLIPRYDTNWSATGPLIEKLTISIRDTTRCSDAVVNPVVIAGTFELGWAARRGGWPGVHYNDVYGETPLIAVCNLILALKEAGRLPSGI